MNRLIEIYKSLSFLFTQIKLTILCIEECIKNHSELSKIKFDENFYNRPGFSMSSRAILSNHCLIQFKSFLDEYKNFNESNFDEKYSESIRRVRKLNQYGIKRINKWKDLEKFRNDILAHNFKANKKSFFNNPNNEIYEYLIPDSLNEKKVCLMIMQKICLNIMNEFPEVITHSNIIHYNIGMNLKINFDNKLDLEEETRLINENM
ncbi:MULTISPECIES: hypothetical protein [Chryseobacterium]|uniref:HEPN AbiU2-like domain-containing protein n=1 Tax=Chryseobacterium formosus TaxID=1537363 RepID=A0ABT3XU36_9FLAO|nr:MULTISPECIES: hypothetical protein [Chryseobacterium]MCX8524694.1 hypothetical protein [Chryseobacterium formosus]HBV15814.1 hypothetical protein [Chryseobacterium carnipullorum]